MHLHPVLRAVTVLGLAAAGLIGGHALGYALAVPDDIHRSALLDATGHGYMPSVSKLALVLGIAAVVAGVMSGYVHRPRRSAVARASLAWRMSLLQCAGFVALEVIERATASASLATLSAGVIVIGLLAQIAVALVVAVLVAGLRRLGAALRRCACGSATATVRQTVTVPERVPSTRTTLCSRVRGPPVVLVV